VELAQLVLEGVAVQHRAVVADPGGALVGVAVEADDGGVGRRPVGDRVR